MRGMRFVGPVFSLPERFVLVIRGTLYDWRVNSVPHEEMARMLTRLFSGETAARSTFARFKMEVEVEEDTDQGPEG